MPAPTRLLTVSTAAAVLAAPVPALAHPPGHDPVLYSSEAVVQPIDGPMHGPAHAAHQTEDVFYDVTVVEDGPPPLPPLPPVPPVPPAAYAAHEAPAPHHAPRYAGHYAQPHPAMHAVDFDRDAWLDDCRDRIRGVDRRERGRVIGGLLGAVAGGVVGNRIDNNRLGGTLLGAGVGGIAGVALGAAIGAAGDRRRSDECAWELDRYMAGGYHGGGYGPAYGYPAPAYGPGYGPAHGYGYAGYSGGVMWVPVVIAVPQRAVVRETVTEEWVEVPVAGRAVTRTEVIHHSAPAPRRDKRVKLIKRR